MTKPLYKGIVSAEGEKALMRLPAVKRETMHSGKSADALTSVSRIRPKLWRKWGSLRGAPGSARPTGGMQIHRRLAISLPQLRWSGHGLDADPYKTKRPLPVPPPAGEGVAHKGDRRGRTWRDRNAEMNATGGCANDCTVCWRSGSPSSVIRLAGDRRMPPSPAGGRKGKRAAAL